MIKKIYLSLTALFAAAYGLHAQVTDIKMGTLNAGYDYDESAGKLSDVYFQVLNNGDASISPFKIGIYLLPPDKTELADGFLIHSINTGELAVNNMFDLSGIEADIEASSEVPTGEYKVVAYADYDEQISESDESNNGVFLSGNSITFTRGGNTALKESNDAIQHLEVFAVPGSANLSINMNAKANMELNLRLISMDGRELATMCKTITTGNNSLELPLVNVVSGNYCLILTDGNGLSIAKKFMINQ
jgi:hypothetical protein